jgi:hypothetical protein
MSIVINFSSKKDIGKLWKGLDKARSHNNAHPVINGILVEYDRDDPNTVKLVATDGFIILTYKVEKDFITDAISGKLLDPGIYYVQSINQKMMVLDEVLGTYPKYQDIMDMAGIKRDDISPKNIADEEGIAIIAFDPVKLTKLDVFGDGLKCTMRHRNTPMLVEPAVENNDYNMRAAIMPLRLR